MSVEQLEQDVLSLSREERRHFLDWLFEHEAELIGPHESSHPEPRAGTFRRPEKAPAQPESTKMWENSFHRMRQRLEEQAPPASPLDE
jgi:hypothetical protein